MHDFADVFVLAKHTCMYVYVCVFVKRKTKCLSFVYKVVATTPTTIMDTGCCFFSFGKTDSTDIVMS